MIAGGSPSPMPAATAGRYRATANATSRRPDRGSCRSSWATGARTSAPPVAPTSCWPRVPWSSIAGPPICPTSLLPISARRPSCWPAGSKASITAPLRPTGRRRGWKTRMRSTSVHKPLERAPEPTAGSAQPVTLSEAELLDLEGRYCSHGDTVHYTNPPKIFDGCEGSFLFDLEGRPYLDLQMWYSAVNFGYRNQRLNEAVRRQLDRLPQVASQYLHREKIELAAMLARGIEQRFGNKGRIHFNVGGSQAVEDSLKLVRNAKNGKSLMFAFEGGYHGRTLGASAITSSYRYRRRYGHFGDRAQFIPFPYHFRGPKGMSKEEHGHHRA